MSHRTLRDLLRGRGAHVDPVAAIEDLPLALAGLRPAGVEQTIWQLVWHMNYWMDYELRSIAGPEADYPEHAAASWPAQQWPSTEAAWGSDVIRFREQIEQLAQCAVLSAQDGTSARMVHPTRGETVDDVLWQMAAHNSYHTGQVVQLRRVLGAWPPPGGGDTW